MPTALPHYPVPMFPLAGVLLYPDQVLPLHIFEPRYRQLVADQLDSQGRFVLAHPKPGRDATTAPAVLPVAGLGEILRHERLPDGRYHLFLLGLCRVRILEVPSDRLYRQVRCEPFVEQPPRRSQESALKQLVREATTQRLGQELPLPPDAPLRLLTDLLLQTLDADRGFLLRCYAEPSVARRATLALSAARGSDSTPAQDLDL